MLPPLPLESLTKKKKDTTPQGKKDPSEWEMARHFGRGVMRESY